MTTRSLRVGVIGTGGMGGRHARNLARHVAHAEVEAVMDVDLERAAQVAAECGQAQVFNDAEALIYNPNVDAVIIASPDPTHARLTLACLAAGKPVLCEKPLATSAAEALEVVRAEEALGRRLVQVGFMREYDPAHRALLDPTVQEQIGRPLLFHGLHTNLSIGVDRTVEDVIVNSAIHDIHSARWLLNDEVSEVFVQYIPASVDAPETCRLLLVHMRMSRGGLAVIECNVDAGYGYEVSVTLTGERGTATTQSLSSPVVRGAHGASQAVEADWLARFDEAYIREVQAWTQSVLDGKPAGPSAWDGYAALVIADACIQSARRGERVKIDKVTG